MSRESDIVPDERPRTLWEHFKRGFVMAHRRRPLSFYLLLAIPVALLLSLHMAEYRGSPHRFALILSLLLLFFAVIAALAVNDFFSLCRKHLSERRALYLDTINNKDFARELGERVRRNRPRQ